ncbi:MAG: multidrug effflux MFS transporter [Acidimicrobiales bacterium]
MSSVATRRRSEASVIAYLAFMGMLLAFGIDASLPAFDELRAAFGLEPESNQITFIITLYFVGTAVGQLLYGPISDRFGRQPALHLGIAIYSIGAIGSIVAPNLGVLFVSRFVWGLGAAAPGVLRAAIARDLYEGNQMARIISVMMGFFLMGPVLAPILGEAILRVGSWEWVFGVALILAAVLVVWSRWFGETLDPELRRSIDVRATAQGFREVFRTRSTRRYTLTLTFGFGAFMVFLGSSQPIISEIYGRGDQFALWFGAAAFMMALFFFSVNRFIDRHGAHLVAVGSAGLALGFSVILLVAALLTDGVPPFAVWMVLIALANGFTTLLTPTCYALGLEPMGDLAGTASAVMGFVSIAGGSALAAVIDASIDGTVTPMAVGYVLYLGVAMLFLRGADPDPARGDAVRSSTAPASPT